MSLILVDAGDRTHTLLVSNAGWRKALEVLRPLGVLSAERFQRMETGGLETFTEAEAKAIGDALVAGPLSVIHWSDNVYPPVGYWNNTRGRQIWEYELHTYWPSWLRAFAAFCLTCKGFIA